MAFDYHDRIARDPGVVGGQAVISGTRRICRGLCTGRSSTRRIHGPVKLKLDENLPRQLVPILTSLGHDVDTGPDEYLAGQVDHAVWTAAQSAGRFLVTQDLDVSRRTRVLPRDASRRAAHQAAAAGSTGAHAPDLDAPRAPRWPSAFSWRRSRHFWRMRSR